MCVLIVGVGFIYLNMYRDVGIVGGINGCGGCVVVDIGNLVGIVVGKDVDRCFVFLFVDCFDKWEAVLINELVVFYVFFGDILGGL